MHDILVVLVHSIVTVVRLIKPGGLRAVVAESALTRHQLLILNRSRKRAPSLRVSDRIIAGLCTLLMHPSRLLRCGIVLKPSTLRIPMMSISHSDLMPIRPERSDAGPSQCETVIDIRQEFCLL